MRVQLVGESTFGRGDDSWLVRVQLVGERTLIMFNFIVTNTKLLIYIISLCSISINSKNPIISLYKHCVLSRARND